MGLALCPYSSESAMGNKRVTQQYWVGRKKVRMKRKKYNRNPEGQVINEALAAHIYPPPAPDEEPPDNIQLQEAAPPNPPDLPEQDDAMLPQEDDQNIYCGGQASDGETLDLCAMHSEPRQINA